MIELPSFGAPLPRKFMMMYINLTQLHNKKEIWTISSNSSVDERNIDPNCSSQTQVSEPNFQGWMKRFSFCFVLLCFLSLF